LSTRFAVLGSPIGHSLSPRLHAAAFAASGRNASYEAIEVDEAGLPEVLARLQAGGYGGVNLTSPLKAAGLLLADRATSGARAAGAVNTLAFDDDGSIRAENTDGPGFVRFLTRAGVDPHGRAVAMLGGGGAAAGLIPALLLAGAGPIAVCVRSPSRTLARYASMAAPGVNVVSMGESESSVRAAAIVVQATPLGLAAGDGLPCPPDWLAAEAMAVDLLYHPPVTPWLAALRARGLRAANGLGLLIEQALLAQHFWFGETPPRRALEEAVAWADPFSAPPSDTSPGT
jgi:shikimate dehydrogenase